MRLCDNFCWNTSIDSCFDGSVAEVLYALLHCCDVLSLSLDNLFKPADA